MKKKLLTLTALSLFSLSASAATLKQMPNEFLGCWAEIGSEFGIEYKIKKNGIDYVTMDAQVQGKTLSISSSNAKNLTVKTKYSGYVGEERWGGTRTESFKLINKNKLKIDRFNFQKTKCSF